MSKLAKISNDTARMLSDYIETKVRRLKDIEPAEVYISAVAGAVGAIGGVIIAIQQRNPELAQQLREKIIKNVTEAGTQ
jgi:hypothetical protein